jgi:hypothetical protein
MLTQVEPQSPASRALAKVTVSVSAGSVRVRF